MTFCLKHLLIISVLAAIVFTHGVASGQGIGDRSPVGALLESLRVLEEGGGFGGPSASDLLDDARENASKLASDRRETRVGQEVSRSFSSDELLLIGAFCRSELTEEQDHFVRTISNFSPLERDYCRRIESPSFLAGYGAFGSIPQEPTLRVGAAREDYTLGVGDELIVTVVGNSGFSRTVTVDSEGRVILPELNPIGAVGLTLDQFRRELTARVETAFVGSEALVSLGAVRSISVFVVGEVNSPGAKQLSALSTALDAINLSGGIKKTGSLRQVTIQRGSEVRWLDLYDLLFGLSDIPVVMLNHGDVIRVPGIKETVAVVGDVKRPGIFEMPEGAAAIDARTAVRLAGGTIRARGNIFSVRSTQGSGRDLITDYDRDEFEVGAGDIISVRRAEGRDLGTVELLGAVTVPGARSLSSTATVGQLLGSGGALREDSYQALAILQTVDLSTGARRYFPIDLQRVGAGLEDYSLRDQDRLIVLGVDDVRYLMTPEVHAALSDVDLEQREDFSPPQADTVGASVGASPTLGSLQGLVSQIQPSPRMAQQVSDASATTRQPAKSCESLVELERIVRESGGTRFSNATQFGVLPTRGGQQDTCRSVYEQNPNLLPFVLEHGVVVHGEVRRPGLYPVSNEVSLGGMVSLAGGATNRAYLEGVELMQFGEPGGDVTRQVVDLTSTEDAARAVANGDVIRVSRAFSDLDGGSVKLRGEFVRPGVYDIRRGERLLSVVARAGGLTAQAYSFGAVFTRESVKRAERVALQRLARELNAAVGVAAANSGIPASAIQSFAELTRAVAASPATGRVVIEADPTVLQVRPELDIVLESGDQIVIPRRPASVLVTGDVLNPGALQFVAGATPDRYIRQAGGFQQSADRQRLFVVFPNGVATPVSVNAFNFTPVKVPPGSTIVVPKDATPFSLLTVSKELASVLSQLAITAASLAVISNQ
ncbi:MAG: SLBB domain-containing protein [Alphaproteobacteria bacterium]